MVCGQTSGSRLPQGKPFAWFVLGAIRAQSVVLPKIAEALLAEAMTTMLAHMKGSNRHPDPPATTLERRGNGPDGAACVGLACGVMFTPSASTSWASRLCCLAVAEPCSFVNWRTRSAESCTPLNCLRTLAAFSVLIGPGAANQHCQFAQLWCDVRSFEQDQILIRWPIALATLLTTHPPERDFHTPKTGQEDSSLRPFPMTLLTATLRADLLVVFALPDGLLERLLHGFPSCFFSLAFHFAQLGACIHLDFQRCCHIHLRGSYL